MSFHSIAIDGPSGAGKSTLARMAARRLGFCYVDTGAIYRTVGLGVQRKGADPRDAAAVTALLGTRRVEMSYGTDGLQHMYLDGEDVTEEIRREEISAIASWGSAIPQVRAFLLDMQRGLARKHDVVMDGRDIGTVVLPDAEVKLFLTASPEERARRRYAQLLGLGAQAALDTVLRDMTARPEKHATRAAAPLKAAPDAVRVDTTGLTLEESAALVLKTIEERLRP